MPGFVKFVGAPEDSAYVIGGDSLQTFRRGPKAKTRVGFKYRWGYEMCSRVAQMLREAGNLTVRAYDEHGQLLGGEPASASVSSPAQGEAASYTSAQDRNGLYREIPPIRKIQSGFCIDWHVFHNNEWQTGSIVGRTPNECVEKLFQTNVPVYEKFIDSLPIVDAPVAQAPTPVDLSALAAFTEKEYAQIPTADLNSGGRYYRDAGFAHRVDLLMKKRKADAAARKAAEDGL